MKKINKKQMIKTLVLRETNREEWEDSMIDVALSVNECEEIREMIKRLDAIFNK